MSAECSCGTDRDELMAQINETRRLISVVERDYKDALAIVLNNLNEQLDSIRYRLIELEDKAENTHRALYCG